MVIVYIATLFRKRKTPNIICFLNVKFPFGRKTGDCIQSKRNSKLPIHLYFKPLSVGL